MSTYFDTLYAYQIRQMTPQALFDAYGILKSTLDPYSFAEKNGIRVSVDMEFAVGIFHKGYLIAALYVPETLPNCFSFDVAVAEDHRAKGLASSLVDIAIAIHDEMAEQLNGSLDYCVSVVSENMRRLLERKSFYVYKTIMLENGNSAYKMTRAL